MYTKLTDSSIQNKLGFRVSFHFSMHVLIFSPLASTLYQCRDPLSCSTPINSRRTFLLHIATPCGIIHWLGMPNFIPLQLASLPQPLEKNLEIMPVATVPARFPVLNAVPARFDAWLNLSHLEKASVFVMVNTSAMTSRKSASLYTPL